MQKRWDDSSTTVFTERWLYFTVLNFIRTLFGGVFCSARYAVSDSLVWDFVNPVESEIKHCIKLSTSATWATPCASTCLSWSCYTLTGCLFRTCCSHEFRSIVCKDTFTRHWKTHIFVRCFNYVSLFVENRFMLYIVCSTLTYLCSLVVHLPEGCLPSNRAQRRTTSLIESTCYHCAEPTAKSPLADL